jgi:hypothetical protein
MYRFRVLFLTAAMSIWAAPSTSMAAPENASAAEEDNDDSTEVALDVDRNSERARIVAALHSSDLSERGKGCRELEFSGITDHAIFELIEQQMLVDLDETVKGTLMVKTIPSCMKALASSGDQQYRTTMQRALHTRPKHGAGYKWALRSMHRSIDMLNQFAVWNTIINNDTQHQPGQPWAATRALNMLQSHDDQLEREGLKRARKIAALYPPIYDSIEAVLLGDVATPIFDPHREDLLAWYCRTLGESGNAKYTATLTKVAESTESKKLKRYAEKAISALSKGAG